MVVGPAVGRTVDKEEVLAEVLVVIGVVVEVRQVAVLETVGATVDRSTAKGLPPALRIRSE